MKHKCAIQCKNLSKILPYATDPHASPHLFNDCNVGKNLITRSAQRAQTSAERQNPVNPDFGLRTPGSSGSRIHSNCDPDRY